MTIFRPRGGRAAPTPVAVPLARVIGGISQRLPQLIDRRVEAVVKVDEGIGRPILIAQLFACDYFARSLQQNSEYVEWLFLELDPDAPLAQLPGAQVHFERSKSQDCGRPRFKGHLQLPLVLERV